MRVCAHFCDICVYIFIFVSCMVCINVCMYVSIIIIYVYIVFEYECGMISGAVAESDCVAVFAAVGHGS